MYIYIYILWDKYRKIITKWTNRKLLITSYNLLSPNKAKKRRFFNLIEILSREFTDSY